MKTHKISELVGNTPLVEITRLNPNKKVRIFAKMEGHNPGGSVKDRAALNMIQSALDRGEIQKGTTLIEATSGNTGIALAMIAGTYNISIELIMPSNSTKERIQTMEAFGAKVILLDTIEACRDYADEKSTEDGYFMLDQFSNQDNYMAHVKTTGPEIWNDTEGNITHFVSSMGTTGTIMGTSMFLKSKNPKIEIIGCQPTDGSSIPGIRRWTPDYLPKIFDRSKVDFIYDVSESEAILMTKNLAAQEGIFVGMSSGGAASVALRIAQEMKQGVMVFICCDRGDRYLSSNIFV
ncbi:MAG: cysteine synthase CysM [Saprospiraceae bacterium]|jgi:cysteine synthase B|nr:cysteine synthase CysM [Saprospiraceae bacterium]